MGALAAMLGIDLICAIGPKAARIADGAADSGGNAIHFETKEEALPTLKDRFAVRTVLLAKASHAMDFGALVEQLCRDHD